MRLCRSQVNRRRALASIGGFTFSVAGARGQPRERAVRLGYIGANTSDDLSLRWIRLGLDRLGWVEGRDYVLVARFAGLDFGRIPGLVDELLRDKSEIIVTAAIAQPVVGAVRNRAPVVFSTSSDPVRAGLVKSMAQPGGNATGVSHLAYDLIGKRIQLLRELEPTSRRILLLSSPLHPGEDEERRQFYTSAERLGFEVLTRHVASRADIISGLEAGAQASCDALTCFADPINLTNRELIGSGARALRWPSTFGRRDFCDAGGLVSYGANLLESSARLAYFIKRIADGAAANELPVELPTVVETVINSATATAIGLSLPPAALSTADHII